MTITPELVDATVDQIARELLEARRQQEALAILRDRRPVTGQGGSGPGGQSRPIFDLPFISALARGARSATSP